MPIPNKLFYRRFKLLILQQYSSQLLLSSLFGCWIKFSLHSGGHTNYTCSQIGLKTNLTKMVDIEEVKIIGQKKTWKLLMLNKPKALQLRKDPIGCSLCSQWMFGFGLCWMISLQRKKATRMQALFPELRRIFEPFTHTPFENIFLIHSSILAWTQSSVTHL